MTWHDGPLLGFDLETTGIHPSSDLPVQVALVWTDAERVLSTDTFLVDPGREIPPDATAIHGITSERARSEGCSLAEAARRIHAAVLRATTDGVPVVAMNAGFDVTIAEGLFAAFALGTLEWRALLDPLVLDRHCDRFRKGKRRLDALCEHYAVRLGRAHDASADAEAAVALTRLIGARYPECGALDPETLTLRQAAWHQAWAHEYDSWRRSQGLAGLEADDFNWPCRRATVPATTNESR
ncbi:MAG: exonuclease domain-containing protein [Actinomycetota bacterium]|nr:exonuclease domain-containing protein [Actinomycetota bacterium]